MVRLSVPRRMVGDLLYFARGIPTVPVQKRMSLAPLAAARAACRERPRWTTLFTKAYALMAREFPEFRRAYVKLPWPHLYEYPASNATVIIERDYYGEPGLFSISIKEPARQSLHEIGRQLDHASTAPIESIKDFRRTIHFTYLPAPIRRALWWICLNFGRQRGNYFGTFGVSVYSALQAESLHPLSPITTLLNYGVISEDGAVDVRIIYDHRVMDGATVARALGRLEQILNSDIKDEVAGTADARDKVASC
jgi:pyruvate/2-oxoglutarate dehydrogenase complex dihydrolipoamide acyltransferase (E2) component